MFVHSFIEEKKNATFLSLIPLLNESSVTFICLSTKTLSLIWGDCVILLSAGTHCRIASLVE